MEREKISEVLKIIQEIEQKQEEVETHLKELASITRDNLLREIIADVIKKNTIIQKSGYSGEDICLTDISDTENTVPSVIETLVSEIRKSPSKKIIYLREFLEHFTEISEQDKNVLLQSIKDRNLDDLKEKLLSLVKIFHVNI